MRLENPNFDIQSTVIGGIQWFDKVKIVGYNVVEIDEPSTAKRKDRVVVAGAGNAMWARFMDVETNKPFFSGRNGEKKMTLAEVVYERRNGYAWYGTSPAKLINEEYPKWASKWIKNKL